MFRSAATKMTGHKTESVYRRYATVDEVMLREGAEKLGLSRWKQEAFLQEINSYAGRKIYGDRVRKIAAVSLRCATLRALGN